MAKSHGEKVALNASAGFALKLVVQGMSFVLKTVFVYTLGKQYNGVSTLFTDILHMLSMAELGVGTAITFALYRPIKEGDTRRVAALMSFYKKAYRIIALSVFLLGCACIPFLPHMVKNVPDILEDIRIVFILYVINSACTYLLSYKFTLLTASERGYIISSLGIRFSLLRTFVECVVLILLKNYYLYLMVGIVMVLCKNIVISRKASQIFPTLSDYQDEKLSRQEVKRLMKDVGALTIYKVCKVILTSTDSIVISWMLPTGVVAVGLLGNYRMLFNTINKIYVQFFESFRPSLGTAAVGMEPKRQHEIFCTTNFISFWSLCFCATTLVVMSTPFVRDIWFNKSFVIAPKLVFAVALNFYISGYGQTTDAFRDSNGLFVQGMYRPLVMAILNIALDIVLIRPLGIFGVLIATSISRLVTQAWYDPWLLYRKIFKMPVRIYYIRSILYFLIVLLCCSVTYLLSGLVGHVVSNIYLAFAIRLIMCIVIPNGVIIMAFRRTREYRDFLQRGRKILHKILRKIRGKGKKNNKTAEIDSPDTQTQDIETQDIETQDTPELPGN